METLNLKIRSAIESDIRTAFRGVALGRGLSLKQAQLADNFGNASQKTPSAFPAGPEVTDDWSRVSLDELERNCVAHLDALGFRYYVPALMLSVLDHYDSSSMRVIGTLGGLYPKKGDEWEYHMHRYSLFSPEQKAAIAQFLAELPKLVELGFEDQKVVERALRNYWGEYLKTSASEQVPTARKT
jgi:hypothetical protein